MEEQKENLSIDLTQDTTNNIINNATTNQNQPQQHIQQPEDDQQSVSTNQYLENEDESLQKKSQQQFKALFYKSISLQSKQIGTNLCQILTPLICLVFVYLIKSLAQSQVGTSFSLPFPFLFNVPGLYNAYPFVHTECLEWYMYDVWSEASEETKKNVGFNTGKIGEKPEGLLSHILNNDRCKFEKDKLQQERNVPFFEHPPEGKTINEALYQTLKDLNKEPFKRGKDIQGSENLPDGAIRFIEVTDQTLKYTVQINDVRMKEYHRNNGITKLMYRDQNHNNEDRVQIRVAEGMLSLMDLIHRSYLRTINKDVWIVSGVQYMPLVGEDSGYIMRIISVTGASLYPLALSLLLPIFMYTIVLEKEEKLLEMMKMNGMRMRDYWVVTYIFCLLISFFTFSIFYLFGYYALALDFFVDTGFSVLATIFTGWALTQISFAIFFQVFLGKARSATIIGYLLSIWTCLISVTFNVAVYPQPYELPYGMRMYPPFGFSRLIYDVSIACSSGACFQNLDQITDEMNDCLTYLYAVGFLFLFLGIYLHEVIPQEYGVQQHPLFFLRVFKKCQKKNKNSHQELIEEDLQEEAEILQLPEDKQAKEERTIVSNINSNFHKYPLIIKNLKKQYKKSGGRKSHIAVKSFCLHLEKGEIFGLLGPNGAGKTTLISMITGMFPPSSGNAYIAGHSIKTAMQQVHLNIGVCPQFNLLWPELTVEEHLWFYARLKGVPRKEQKEKIKTALKEVYLTQKAHHRTRELSGGMQRRLSVAISLVGDPKIIFLDEPSTGLDPENRRQLWDILAECRDKRAMVLTTHSMEEADVLCNRIGIITKGVLRCVGPQVSLKKDYGGGYHLYINCYKDKYYHSHVESREDDVENISREQSQEDYQKRVSEYISEILPRAKEISNFNGNFIYQIPMEGLKVSQLFEKLEENKNRLRISDWGISQSSLEDVFMKIVNSADEEELNEQQQQDAEQQQQEN